MMKNEDLVFNEATRMALTARNYFDTIQTDGKEVNVQVDNKNEIDTYKNIFASYLTVGEMDCVTFLCSSGDQERGFFETISLFTASDLKGLHLRTVQLVYAEEDNIGILYGIDENGTRFVIRQEELF
jgi:hypothetical protein